MSLTFALSRHVLDIVSGFGVARCTTLCTPHGLIPLTTRTFRHVSQHQAMHRFSTMYPPPLEVGETVVDISGYWWYAPPFAYVSPFASFLLAHVRSPRVFASKDGHHVAGTHVCIEGWNKVELGGGVNMREFIFIFCVCLCFTPTLVTKAPMRWYLSGWKGLARSGLQGDPLPRGL